ncbi:MAG: hypothetical protein HFF37_07900 [Coprobacillus sp.]|nr:hypothetical protein [Coprobacillus sp.]
MYTYSQSTGVLKDDDELIYDITGIEYLRNTSSINLSYNKISDLSPLDMKHISELAEQEGEMAPDVLTGEKWYSSYGQNLYFDFRGNPINKYPEKMAGRLNWSELDSVNFELKTNPYILLKEDGTNQKFNGEIEIPLIEKGEERIDIKPDSCHIVENNILGSTLKTYTKEKIVLNDLTHSGEVKIEFSGADDSQLKGYKVDTFDMSEVISSPLNSLIKQPIRIYTPVTLTSLPTDVVISLKVLDSSKDSIGLKGAVFHLFSADLVDGKYVPQKLYNQTDYITDENGKVMIQEKLPAGYYCLVQKKTEENYLLEKNSYGFHIENTVSLTGGTPEFVTSQGKEVKSTPNVTYIDRYSPNVSLTENSADKMTIKKVKLTYFDRNLQDYKDIEFVEDALQKTADWLNTNKGDENTLGLIDGSVSIQVEYQMNTEIEVTNERLGGLVITNTVSDNGVNKNHKFPFTLTLDDTSINGVYGELNFVNGIAVFELANGESVTIKGLPKNIGYSVVENDTFGYTVTSENAKGKITNEMGMVVFHNHIKNTEDKPSLPEHNQPDTVVKPIESTKPTKPNKSHNSIPKTEDRTLIYLWTTLIIISSGLIAVLFEKRKI